MIFDFEKDILIGMKKIFDADTGAPVDLDVFYYDTSTWECRYYVWPPRMHLAMKGEILTDTVYRRLRIDFFRTDDGTKSSVEGEKINLARRVWNTVMGCII